MTEEQTTKRQDQSTSSQGNAGSSKGRSTTKKQSSGKDSQPKRRAKPKLPAGKAAVSALQQLQALTTRTPESVVGVIPYREGWRVTVEVVESPRIPNTADIMAEYDVDIDANGDLAGYTRRSRYFRGRTQEAD